MEVHYKFKEARKSARLTQKEVAQALNVTAATYSRYENGLIQPDPETLKRIAVLNIKP
ncbi:helix-turn-helix domain-containing protein [uncultured Phascolarctobacterium sp.]|uniref:helix-turn-helix domain-containing protein n=1 Tax=uncultured Phascolarctobacterium sp. TaxID=512296 RepID=UPI0026187ECF|nr:helix-turn-helix transcriptional regulator [uncultured Phascolarctobacterium sp.]